MKYFLMKMKNIKETKFRVSISFPNVNEIVNMHGRRDGFVMTPSFGNRKSISWQSQDIVPASNRRGCNFQETLRACEKKGKDLTHIASAGDEPLRFLVAILNQCTVSCRCCDP